MSINTSNTTINNTTLNKNTINNHTTNHNTHNNNINNNVSSIHSTHTYIVGCLLLNIIINFIFSMMKKWWLPWHGS